MDRPDTKAQQPHSTTVDGAFQSHPLVTDGFEDLPPSYEASTATSAAVPPLPSAQSPRSSTESTRSHSGLLGASSQPAPEPQPSASGPRHHAMAEGYQQTSPMSWEQRDWDALRSKPGCCGSSSGGCCFSSRGGCCFSDRGGCCFSDREGCCFSDRAGCCCGDTGGACCASNGACCMSEGPTQPNRL